MAGDKYAKCIKTGSLIKEISYYTGKSIVAHNGELDADCSLGYHYISKPISFDKPHAHNFAEILCFVGGDSRDVTDLGAEIEVTLGDEKHLINTAAVVSIPPNLLHCPIIIKKVERPFVFLEISLTCNYKQEGSSGKKPAG